jgi:phage repressor protein C with HTH and peptisase S24 domain
MMRSHNLQSCYAPEFSIAANLWDVTGLEADTEFVKELCRWAQLAPSALAKRAGLAATTILRPYQSTASTRMSQPTFDKLRAAFPDFPGWRREYPDQPGMLGDRTTELLHDARTKYEPHPEIVYVREVDISLAMGEGAVVEDFPPVQLVPFNLNFIKSITTTLPENLVVMTGHGESMEPTLLRSDFLMIDTSVKVPIVSDQIWAFHYAGGGMIKRLRRVRERGEDRFLILSDNPTVPDQFADIEDIHIIGKLVWVGRRM